MAHPTRTIPPTNTPAPDRAASAPTPLPFPSTDDQQDLQIIEAIRSGDNSAWTRLIQRYQDRLFSVCVRMVHDRELATDLTQDAFIKIIQGLDSFDGRAKFSTWAIRITMNVCLSKLRSEKLRRHASLDAPAKGGDAGEGESPSSEAWGREQTRELAAASSVEAHEDRRRVLLALRELEPDQRAVIILADCRGLAYEHIAEVLGVAVGTVKSRLFRARASLRDTIERQAERQSEQ